MCNRSMKESMGKCKLGLGNLDRYEGPRMKEQLECEAVTYWSEIMELRYGACTR